MIWALGSDPSASGVFNTVGATVIDRLAFSQQICEELGLDPSLIDPTDTASLGQAAARPLRGGLLMDKLQTRYPALDVLGSREGLAELHRQMRVAANTGA